MSPFDTDAAIRDRAYSLWEEAGRPSGFEHVHWAEAKRELELQREAEIVLPRPATPASDAVERETAEIRLLRAALYTPEPFSIELFGHECPEPEPESVSRAA